MKTRPDFQPLQIIIICLICLIQGGNSMAQSLNTPIFSSGDRICFVGNSITNNGEFHHNLLLYHMTRFPQQQVRFFNCGISGDVTQGILNRMEDDILIHNPTHIVLMIGMNDVSRSLYSNHPVSNADTLRRRTDAILIYKENLEKIIRLFLSKNIQVILQKPSIYDQTAVNSTFNNLGVNDALKTCADFIGSLAEKYQLPVIDYWTIMNQINLEMQKKNPAATITGNDRVHPAASGHLVMAYQFLKTMNAPRFVSGIYIGKNKLQKCIECSISHFKQNKDVLSFSLKENALPFPTISSQTEGLKLVPFEQDFNLQMLHIGGLKKGMYSIFIDSVLIGEFSSLQLEQGINLADYHQSPQFQQALAVRNVLVELWKNEATLRGIKFIEFNPYFKSYPEKSDLAMVKTYLDSMFTIKYSSNAAYYKQKLNEYLLNKVREEDLKIKLESLRQEAFQLVQPAEHQYRVTYSTK